MRAFAWHSFEQKCEPLRRRASGITSSILRQMLTQLDQLAAMVAQCDARILEVSKPFEANIQRLQTIVGVGRRTAEVLVSEIGVDMSRFSTAGHLASWARICPGNYESGITCGVLRNSAAARADAAYQDFFNIWKDADPDIPILKQAKAEYAKLQ